ncbi:Plant UBX domain-containing protein 10 [Gracilariopsis chorda]|uniref:Plant UBX domain-containing protein 10 n=1 Tax=Gracilariopsis chorda TaxID=448386 RepID=A0A2V3J266_9FLOR|nr:Plant UBX domain-containing protein 10 [Gracilariopsis chorda]|eukprot:PXF48469.1 Plant UBX domain-containing protein 10 [Gracilariopsis chorda]
MVHSEPSEEQRKQHIDALRAAISVPTDAEALRLLRAHDWDLNRAASAYFDGAELPPESETAPPVPPAAAPASTTALTTVPAPVPAQIPHTSPTRSPTPRWLLALLSPFRFVWSFISRLTQSLLNAIGGPARLIEAAPGETPTHRFLNFFDDKYGPQRPSFLTTSYLQALQSAHSQLKFLLVYIHSESHRLTPAFVRQVISNPTFISAVDDSVLSWAGSITQRDAAAVQSALRVPALPFLAIVAAPSRTSSDLSRANFGTVLSIRAGSSALVGGAEGTAAWIARVVQRHSHILTAIRQQRVDRENARLLREQQDAEYAAALVADRLAEQKAAEEREKEEGEQRRKEELQIRRDRKREALGEEPEKGPGIASVVLRLPDGSRVGRRFSKDEALEKVFDWAEVNRVDIEVACLVVAFPRKSFRYPEDADITIERAGLFPSCMLLLEERSSDA